MELIKVKFLYHEANDDLFAFFVNDNIAYSHIGQHSACSEDYADECRLATRKEYADLKAELISIGYILEVIHH